MSRKNTPTRRHDWVRLPGTTVEIRRNGEHLRTGLVDEATPDSTMLWLVHDGVHSRTLIEKTEGYEVWTTPRTPGGS